MKKLTDLSKLSGDKYSKRIRAWLKKYNYCTLKVLWIKWDSLNGLNSDKGTFYFVFDEDFGITGANIMNITTQGNKATGCFVRFGDTHPDNIEKKDVTSWFIKNYTEKGACLIHDFNHKFKQINKNSRKCEHCGKIETREIKQKRVNKRIEVWA